MSPVRTNRLAVVRLERAHQLINLSCALFNSPRLANLACGPERARFLEKMLT